MEREISARKRLVDDVMRERSRGRPGKGLRVVCAGHFRDRDKPQYRETGDIDLTRYQ